MVSLPSKKKTTQMRASANLKLIQMHLNVTKFIYRQKMIRLLDFRKLRLQMDKFSICYAWIYKRKICKPRIKESTEEVKFTWSVDELAIFRPVNFDDAEFSLPPDDWNPNPHHDVEKFWSRNTQIFPSPDIQNVFRPVGENYTKSSSSSSPNCYSYSSEDFYGQNSTESSSSRSTSNKRFIHSSDNSPDDALLFKLDNIKDEKENEHEFEQIEHSLSIGDDADQIFADLEHESGSFVMRQQVNSPIEKCRKVVIFRG
uniref:Uncharacterized protein n=1 Tax=Meloidogyne enterolobii TaxID=390850 RepID=A0A6V7XNB2_MELEN|nr:unnamed protein product [Meloidogyne enterolobii]